MKKFQKLILGIILVLLIIIALLIGISIGNRNTIQKQLEETQKLTATSEENSYITTADHLAEVNASVAKLTEFKKEIASAITDVGVATAENADATTMSSNIRSLSEVLGADSVTLKSGEFTLVNKGTSYEQDIDTGLNEIHCFILIRKTSWEGATIYLPIGNYIKQCGFILATEGNYDVFWSKNEIVPPYTAHSPSHSDSDIYASIITNVSGGVVHIKHSTTYSSLVNGDYEWFAF